MRQHLIGLAVVAMIVMILSNINMMGSTHKEIKELRNELREKYADLVDKDKDLAREWDTSEYQCVLGGECAYVGGEKYDAKRIIERIDLLSQAVGFEYIPASTETRKSEYKKIPKIVGWTGKDINGNVEWGCLGGYYKDEATGRCLEI